MTKKYMIKYEVGEYDGKTIRENGLGGTDILFLIATILSEDGGRSYAMAGVDGRTGDSPSDFEWFRAMSIIANHVKDSEIVPKWASELCTKVHETIKNKVLEDR